MKNKIRNVWFKRQFPTIKIKKDDSIFEVSKDIADTSTPVYEVYLPKSTYSKFYIIEDVNGKQV